MQIPTQITPPHPILLMGGLNINTLTQTNSSNTVNHLMDFCDLSALSNLVNVKTCKRVSMVLLLT